MNDIDITQVLLMKSSIELHTPNTKDQKKRIEVDFDYAGDYAEDKDHIGFFPTCYVKILDDDDDCLVECEICYFIFIKRKQDTDPTDEVLSEILDIAAKTTKPFFYSHMNNLLSQTNYPKIDYATFMREE